MTLTQVIAILWITCRCFGPPLSVNYNSLDIPSRGVWPSCATFSLPRFRLIVGIVILMGIKRLPRINNYWSRDSFIGVPGMNQYMSVTIFWAVWSNLHVRSLASSG